MTEHFIAYETGGYQIYRLVNGKFRLSVGLHFDGPRAAMAYCDSLNDPATRPSVDDLARVLGNVPDRRDARLTPGSPDRLPPRPDPG